MDTLGLSALGLTDLECHFRGLDSRAVSRVLYNTAIYLAERGPVIEDGHTVPGIHRDEKWKCRQTRSLRCPTESFSGLSRGRRLWRNRRRTHDP